MFGTEHQTTCNAAVCQIRFQTMTAEQILDEIPADFVEALDDFEHGRFVSMETALNQVPPGH
jgi:hypothetical protein